MRAERAWAIALGFAAPLALLLACGSRTGLLVPDVGEQGDDGSVVLPDGQVPNPDVRHPLDSGPDAIPPIDARPLRDVNVDICRDAGATLIYVVTETNSLLRFDPPAAQFARIGTIACPDPNSPFSMAVDRQGIAYVLFAVFGGQSQGNLYRVSLVNSTCATTTFASFPGFESFGMGFAADDVGTGETLYVASDNQSGGELGAIDPKTLALTPVGFFDPPIVGAELTGTGDGRLFAFYTQGGPQGTGPTAIAQIDKTTAKVIAQNTLPGVTQGQAWAFAFWGGDFYLFTAPGNGGSIVQRFRPTDHSITQVASFTERIVGAGVSTCAPEK